MAQITFHVSVNEENDGSYWAEVKELPGCFASGFSMEELQEALIEAIQMCLPKGITLGDTKWLPDDGDASKKSARGKAPKRKMLVCA